MGFRINTNIAAMNAHANSLMNNRNLDSSLSKLSSGLRINTAADDASGLAIANSLRAQASSLGQAIANGNDAVGLIQTADGALSEYSNILNTIKTKSVQAASDTQNSASRLAIQKDIDKLMEELNTIATTTSFNGQKLLSGTFTNKEFQMGANANESVKVSVDSTETSKVGLTTRTTLDLVGKNGGQVALNLTSASTGVEIQLRSINIQANNDPLNGMGALAAEINKVTNDTGISAKAVVESTTGTIKGGTTGSDFAINGISIGSVIVEAGDTSGSLLAAINGKASQTGVSATLNSDGSMKLTSTDGRAIKVEGDISSVLGASATDLTTIGHLELVQKGASDFQISNKSAGAVGMLLTVKTTISGTEDDSFLSAGSQLADGSSIAKGSVLGGEATVDVISGTESDSKITSGSTLISGSVLAEGTITGGEVQVDGVEEANQDMLVTAGSVLQSGTILEAGTVVTTSFTDSDGDVHNVGETLLSAATLDASVTLNADMTVKNGSTIGSSSTLAAGSFMGMDITAELSVDITQDMVLKSGSDIAASSTLQAGSSIGEDFTIDGAMDITEDMLLKAGSNINADSELTAGSTLGSDTTLKSDTVLSTDMSLKTGSTITVDSVLKAGTVVTEDFATATFDSGTTYKAGDVLEQDETVATQIVTTADMTLTAGSTLKADSILAKNDGKSGTIDLGETTNSSLADIDVTTLEGAMKAIDTVSAAITDLDTIRSNLGSAQNQIVSTINNISVTQVNVKAAESSIRDVDFAAESANFSKFNILAQSGSYAMSQANAVQQNVMRLLQ